MPRKRHLNMLGMLCGGDAGERVRHTGVPGLYVTRGLVSSIDEAALLREIDLDEQGWTERRTRLTKNYGPYYLYGERSTSEGRFRITDGRVHHTPLPAYVDELLVPLLQKRFECLHPFTPNQMHVALYRKDASDRIRMHNDCKMGTLAHAVVGISLGAPCVMTFSHPNDKRRRRLIRLPRRSAYVMTGPALRVWRHGILAGHTSANRVSLTLRQVEHLNVPRGVQVRRSSHTPSQSSIVRSYKREREFSSGLLYRPAVRLIDEVPVSLKDGFEDADAFERACARFAGDVEDVVSSSTLSLTNFTDLPE